MSTPALSLDGLTIHITQDIHVKAGIETTYAALLEQLGPYNETPQLQPLPMVLEPWPGGRWFRDLGNGSGHCWGTVQAIKRPTLLEIYGPLFMSYPVANNVQYRLSEENGGTLIKFSHAAFGLIIEQHKTGVTTGWNFIHQRVAARAESARTH